MVATKLLTEYIEPPMEWIRILSPFFLKVWERRVLSDDFVLFRWFTEMFNPKDGEIPHLYLFQQLKQISRIRWVLTKMKNLLNEDLEKYHRALFIFIDWLPQIYPNYPVEILKEAQVCVHRLAVVAKIQAGLDLPEKYPVEEIEFVQVEKKENSQLVVVQIPPTPVKKVYQGDCRVGEQDNAQNLQRKYGYNLIGHQVKILSGQSKDLSGLLVKWNGSNCKIKSGEKIVSVQSHHRLEILN